MAFVRIEKSNVGQWANRGPEIRLGLNMQSDKVARSVYIAMTPATVAEVGWAVKQTDSGRTYVRIEVHEGTYEDQGFLMIVQSEMGYVLGTNKGNITTGHEGSSLTCHISMSKFKHYVPNELIDVPPVPVEYTVSDGGLLVQCPEWLRYNPLSLPPPPVKEAASPHPHPTIPTRVLARAAVDEQFKGSLPPLNRMQRRRLATTLAKTVGE